MKYTYKWSTPAYEVGECERIYSDMAKKGYFLDGVGSLFDRYKKGEPKDIIYRVEFSDFRIMPELNGIPAEQIEFYEACGWSLAANKGHIYVFCAPTGSTIPELHTEPEGLKAMHKNMKKRNLQTIFLLLFISLNLLFAQSITANTAPSIHNIFANTLYQFVTQPIIFLGFTALSLLVASEILFEVAATAKLKRIITKNGKVDRTRHIGVSLRRIYTNLLLLSSLSLFVLGFFLNSSPTEPLPSTADGPYILLTDPWHGGIRNNNGIGGQCDIHVRDTIISTMYDTHELVDIGKSEAWLYQDVISLKHGISAMPLVKPTIENATFERDFAEYSTVEMAGFDAVYLSAFEAVAVKDNIIWIFTYNNTANKDKSFPIAILEQVLLAEEKH